MALDDLPRLPERQPGCNFLWVLWGPEKIGGSVFDERRGHGSGQLERFGGYWKILSEIRLSGSPS